MKKINAKIVEAGFYVRIGPDNSLFCVGFGLDDDLDGEESYNTDDKLSPLQKLEKYMQSDNVYTRYLFIFFKYNVY